MTSTKISVICKPAERSKKGRPGRGGCPPQADGEGGHPHCPDTSSSQLHLRIQRTSDQNPSRSPCVHRRSVCDEAKTQSSWPGTEGEQGYRTDPNADKEQRRPREQGPCFRQTAPEPPHIHTHNTNLDADPTPFTKATPSGSQTYMQNTKL